MTAATDMSVDRRTLHLEKQVTAEMGVGFRKQTITNKVETTHESLFITTLIYSEMYFINIKSSCLQNKIL